MKYESKKNPGTFLTTDGVVDPKTKTVFVTMEDGKEKSLSVSTLKRWWNKVDEAEQEEATEAEATEDKAVEEEVVEDEAAEEEAVEDEAVEEEETDEAEPAEEESDSVTADEQMTSTIKVLSALFGAINSLYFEGELPLSGIVVETSKRAYGKCIWEEGLCDDYLFKVGAGLLDSSDALVSALSHEMVHAYCHMSGTADTCQHGRYHNKFFKDACESRDIVVSYDKANGYATTYPSTVFYENLANFGLDIGECKFPHFAPTKGHRKSRKQAEQA